MPEGRKATTNDGPGQPGKSTGDGAGLDGHPLSQSPVTPCPCGSGLTVEDCTTGPDVRWPR